MSPKEKAFLHLSNFPSYRVLWPYLFYIECLNIILISKFFLISIGGFPRISNDTVSSHIVADEY